MVAQIGRRTTKVVGISPLALHSYCKFIEVGSSMALSLEMHLLDVDIGVRDGGG